MEFYLWVVRWMSYVHITLWNAEGQKPKQSLDWLVQYETKSTFMSLWKTTTNTFLCPLFLSLSDTLNLESASIIAGIIFF